MRWGAESPRCGLDADRGVRGMLSDAPHSRFPLRPAMSSPLPQLRRRLRYCSTREEAMRAWLGAVLVCGESLLPRSEVALSRAMYHRRRDGVYTDFFLVSGSQSASKAPIAPSSTAWAKVQALQRPVVIAVEESQASLQTVRMLAGRGATHLLAFPAGEGAMVCIEARAPRQRGGGHHDWATVRQGVLALVVEGAALVSAFPDAAPQVDAAFPVVGAATRGVASTLQRFARVDDTVLLLGETGTGKTRAARWLHDNSPREPHPFVEVQVQSIPEGLVEGELFGWIPGAFAGARRKRTGLVPRAHEGTLFIDEVHRLPLAVQDKLLRLFDEKTYRVLGDDGDDRTVDARIVVAASVDLEAEVAAGRFRPDLYYRLSCLPVQIPPLRERLDELPRWVARFADLWLQNTGGEGSVEVSASALGALRSHPWPGNLRELNQVVRRALLLADPDADGVWHLSDTDFGGLGRAALRTERPGRAAMGLVEATEHAAELWARHLVEGTHGVTPAGDHAPERVFRSAVYRAVESRVPQAREAAVTLGLESQVRSRNHTKALQRERLRWAAWVASQGRVSE